jgi:hypothetical protein
MDVIEPREDAGLPLIEPRIEPILLCCAIEPLRILAAWVA